MIKRSSIRQFCILSVQALLLATWLPLFAVLDQPLVTNLSNTQLKQASEPSTWPMDVLQAEIVAVNDDQNEVMNAAAKALVCFAGTPPVLQAVNPSSFHLTPCCQMRRFGSAILPERAPPFSFS